MQDCIKINDEKIYQPDRGLGYDFAVTYTEDSERTQNGIGHFTPLFTVERLSYTATNIPQPEATKILKAIDSGRSFKLHYFSLHYGEWRDGTFYVGQGEMEIGSLEDENRYLSSLSFDMTGVNPI